MCERRWRWTSQSLDHWVSPVRHSCTMLVIVSSLSYLHRLLPPFPVFLYALISSVHLCTRFVTTVVSTTVWRCVFFYIHCVSKKTCDHASTTSWTRTVRVHKFWHTYYWDYSISNKCAKTGNSSSTYRRRRNHMFFGTPCTWLILTNHNWQWTVFLCGKGGTN